MDTEKEINDIAVQSIERDANEHGVQFTRAGLSSLLNQEAENDVVQVITRDELLRDVAGLQEPTSPDPDEEGTDDLEEVYSLEKQLMSLEITKYALDWHNSLTPDVLKALTQCQRMLRL